MEKNKKIISVSLDKDLVDRINAAAVRSGVKSRSSYVEDIIDRHLTHEDARYLVAQVGLQESEGGDYGTEKEPVIIPEN